MLSMLAEVSWTSKNTFLSAFCFLNSSALTRIWWDIFFENSCVILGEPNFLSLVSRGFFFGRPRFCCIDKGLFASFFLVLSDGPGGLPRFFLRWVGVTFIGMLDGSMCLMSARDWVDSFEFGFESLWGEFENSGVCLCSTSVCLWVKESLFTSFVLECIESFFTEGWTYFRGV